MQGMTMDEDELGTALKGNRVLTVSGCGSCPFAAYYMGDTACSLSGDEWEGPRVAEFPIAPTWCPLRSGQFTTQLGLDKPTIEAPSPPPPEPPVARSGYTEEKLGELLAAFYASEERLEADRWLMMIG